MKKSHVANYCIAGCHPYYLRKHLEVSGTECSDGAVGRKGRAGSCGILNYWSSTSSTNKS